MPHPISESTDHIETTVVPASVEGRRDSRGTATVVVVYSDGSEAPLEMARGAGGEPESDGFEWGYCGQGPYALAVSLLALVAGVRPKRKASTHDRLRERGYHVVSFRDHVVATLEPAGWTLSVERLRELAFLYANADELLGGMPRSATESSASVGGPA